MPHALFTETDVKIRDSVMRQLAWEPDIDATSIGVFARSGAVTLTGYIDSYAGKLAAERAAKHVRGVRAVANDIEVRLRLGRTDTDIALDAVRALEIHSGIPSTVQATVHSGRVTLTGTVNWLSQKMDAEAVVRHIRGVRDARSHISVAPHATERDVQHRVVQALHRNADLNARQISVTANDDTIVLKGTVATWLQREQAERAAAVAPGVRNVDNQLLVELPQHAHLDEPVDEIC